MYPIILQTTTSEEADKFLDVYKKNHQVSDIDTFVLHPDKNGYVVAQIKELLSIIKIYPKNKRLIVLYDFQDASAIVQNALLKTLEEKTASNQFILITTSLESVLSTVRSRSTIIDTQNGNRKSAVRPELGSALDKIESGIFYAFLADPLFQSVSKDNLPDLFDEIALYYQHKLLTHAYAPEIIMKTLHTKSLFLSNNLNPQMALDGVLLTIYMLSHQKPTTP